jgi:hypothetical protein
MPYDLLPRPRRLSPSGATLDCSGARWVLVDPELPARVRDHTRRFARKHASQFPGLQVSAGRPANGSVLLRLEHDGSLPPQGYALQTRADGALLRARDAAGAFYGLQTMGQVLRQSDRSIEGFHLEDWPDFPARGVMLDISRCKVPRMETLFGLVDLLAGLKLNQLQLYTEHTFAYSAHEVVWADASPMTPQQVLELDAYCRDRHVELVPNQNSFGHFGRWLKHPGYKHLAECPEGYETPWGRRVDHGSTLRPNDESLELLRELYSELLPNFTSGLFNVGCDETWELGRGWSAPLCEQRGSSTRVYLDFLRSIQDLVAEHERTMMFWGDIILKEPELIESLPPDTIALEWGYEFDHDFAGRCEEFAEAGVPFYVCPGTSSWNSLVGRIPNALGNLASAARQGLAHGACGYLVTDWGDGGHHQHLPVSYPGYAAGAAHSWCLETNEDLDLEASVNRHILRDPTGTAGAVLFGMGRQVDRVQKRFHNKSVFNSLLFGGDISDALEGVVPDELHACVDTFEELARMVPRARPGRPDAGLLRRELANGLALARAGCLRGLAVLGEDIGTRDLYADLRSALGRFEDIWLTRNRPGGLHESSARLRHIIDNLD